MADKRRRARVQGGWASNKPKQQATKAASSTPSMSAQTSENPTKIDSKLLKLQPVDTQEFTFQPSQVG